MNQEHEILLNKEKQVEENKNEILEVKNDIIDETNIKNLEKRSKGNDSNNEVLKKGVSFSKKKTVFLYKKEADLNVY